MSIKTWSENQEQELIKLYTEDEVKDVHQLADHFSKGYRSVISKLVQLRIYEKPQPDEDNKSITVKLLLRELEDMLDIEIEGTNLSKKENLVKLMEALRSRLADESS
jgi:hypothetical protein